MATTDEPGKQALPPILTPAAYAGTRYAIRFAVVRLIAPAGTGLGRSQPWRDSKGGPRMRGGVAPTGSRGSRVPPRSRGHTICRLRIRPIGGQLPDGM
jgi:hypothetical protein